MAERFGATVVIDRPIEEVFAFLADGENDKKFSARVIEISKTTDGPSGKGTIYKNTVKDAGFKTKREFELTDMCRRMSCSTGELIGDCGSPSPRCSVRLRARCFRSAERGRGRVGRAAGIAAPGRRGV
jgi:hypothetical protein